MFSRKPWLGVGLEMSGYDLGISAQQPLGHYLDSHRKVRPLGSKHRREAGPELGRCQVAPWDTQLQKAFREELDVIVGSRTGLQVRRCLSTDLGATAVEANLLAILPDTAIQHLGDDP